MAGINIPINAEISGFLNQLGLVEKEVENITAQTTQAGNTIKQSFSGSGINKINTELQKTDGLIEDIEKSIKDWEVAKRKATNTTDIEKYNKKIAEGKLHLQEYNTKGVPALKNVNAEATKGQSIFSKLTMLIGAAFSVQQVISFGVESAKVYLESEKMVNRLGFAVKQVGGGSDSDLAILNDQATQLMGIFDDEAIREAQIGLLNYGLSAKKVAEIMPLITDVAAQSGRDLSEVSDAIIRGIEGQTRGLKLLGVDLKDTGNATENLAIIQTQLSKFTGGAADALNTEAGGLQALDVQIKETEERIGKSTAVLYNYWVQLKEIGIKFLETAINLNPFSGGAGQAKKDAESDLEKWNAYEKKIENIVKNLAIIGKTSTQSAAQSILESSRNEFAMADTLYKDAKKKGNETEELRNKRFYAELKYKKVLELINKDISDKPDNPLVKPLTDAGIAAQEKYNAAVLEADKALAQMRIDAMDEGAEKLISSEQKRYDEELAKLRDSLKNKYLSETEYNDAIELSKEIHAVKLLKIQQDIDKAIKTERDAQIGYEKTRIDNEFEYNQAVEKLNFLSVKKTDEEIADFELKQLKDKQNRYKKGSKERIDLGIQVAEKEIAINKAKNDKIDSDAEKEKAKNDKIDSDNEKKDQELKELKIEFAKQTGEAIYNILINAEQEAFNKQMGIINNNYDSQIKALDNLNKKKLISTSEYEKRKQEIEDEKNKKTAELERKDAIRKKELALFNIAIKTAENIVFSANPITAAMIPWIIAMGVLEAAVVASQPIPKFKKGGKLGGLPHSLGGIMVEAEKDEWFINKVSSQKYDNVLNNINKDNSFAALSELAKLNGINIDHSITDNISQKERLIERQKLSLNEIPEIKEIRDLLKKDKKVIFEGNGYRIEKQGNIERTIYKK